MKEFDVIETSNDLMSAEDARRLLRFMDREDASRWTASEKMLYVYAHTVVVQAEQIAALRTALVEVERRGAVGYRRPASSHDPRCDAARNYEAPCSCPDSL